MPQKVAISGGLRRGGRIKMHYNAVGGDYTSQSQSPPREFFSKIPVTVGLKLYNATFPQALFIRMTPVSS